MTGSFIDGRYKFKNYIATFARATVDVEDKQHPVMKGVSPTFTVEKEEWYMYDKDPRPNVYVLIPVNELTYILTPILRWAAIIRWFGQTSII